MGNQDDAGHAEQGGSVPLQIRFLPVGHGGPHCEWRKSECQEKDISDDEFKTLGRNVATGSMQWVTQARTARGRQSQAMRSVPREIRAINLHCHQA